MVLTIANFGGGGGSVISAGTIHDLRWVKVPAHIETPAIKTMVGCTPRGAVSFVSDCYGGSVSDRQIIEDSNILDNSMFDSGDSIMADRSIMVQDLFANQNVCVNTPTMLKGKSQLEPEEFIRDRRVASKRIHIERVIGPSKTFKILRIDLSNTKLQLANRIVNVCFRLTNFKNVIVDKFA